MAERRSASMFRDLTHICQCHGLKCTRLAFRSMSRSAEFVGSSVSDCRFRLQVGGLLGLSPAPISKTSSLDATKRLAIISAMYVVKEKERAGLHRLRRRPAVRSALRPVGGTRVNDWESVFRAWSKPASDSEEERYQRTERMIRVALESLEAFNERSYTVFTQGSYRNNTNVRLESDVDIVVRSRDALFSDRNALPAGTTDADLGLVGAPYRYAQFKDDVQAALVATFGASAIDRGNKAIHVRASSARVNADVVAAFEHRRYQADRSYVSGIEFPSDTGERIINWPDQHYASGVSKNSATSRRFKATVRILKRLRNRMASEGIEAARPIPSFLTECLVWNVPSGSFGHETYTADVRSVLASTFTATLTDSACSEWLEVSELKYLFRGGKPLTRQQSHSFLSRGWDYLGFA